MDLPTPNIPLLRKAVEWAEAEAAKTDGTGLWNQVLYAGPAECGTAYCIAGYAVTTGVPGARANEWGDLQIDGVFAEWRQAGIEALGITLAESYDLFDPANGISRVRRIAEQIAARAGERL